MLLESTGNIQTENVRSALDTVRCLILFRNESVFFFNPKRVMTPMELVYNNYYKSTNVIARRENRDGSVQESSHPSRPESVKEIVIGISIIIL